ncbi:GNAT family N-acetyltransferase [Neptunomonas qingdaonensis]|uniref:Acetyltransferase (GNAT) domain-containing protein n=1 Tax=Neptunomonas qingdaonensis TaxID=1045558 RepID=A0A1I2MTM4_9GAMM|nr:GNAT family N-acetyltransferase [Neptunomonas qingdaonensis]SFF94925.1 Acetyltransferase (GNAT) domain-containing protein [Neptunomonas qingdaonensis]
MKEAHWQFYPIDKFNSWINQWDLLNKQTHYTPLLDSDFILPLISAFSTGKEKIAIHGSDSKPEAMAIIVESSIGNWSTFQPSQAPIGCWLQNRNKTTEFYMESLRKELPFPALCFSITQQDPDILAKPQQSKLLTIPYIETARVSLTGTFDDYWGSRGKNLRQNLNKQRNRLTREGFSTKLITLTKAEDINASIEAYGNLESAGWKSEGNTAISINNVQGQFYVDMLTRFASRKKCMVYQYWYNEDLVATDLCITGGGAIIILKTTYDETIKISSPALLMRQDAFRELFEIKYIQRVEFYGKVMEWHTRWSDEVRQMYHINSYSMAGTFFRKIKKIIRK